MKAIVFGATGMLGQGVVHEALADPGMEAILLVGRRPSGVSHPKAKDLVLKDLFDYSPADFAGYDACFFCLGVSSAGMSEADYTRITHDLTLAAARAMPKALTFCYVTGAGTGGTSMWARVKKRTEDDLLALGFKAAYMFRPGYIQPLQGIKSRTPAYRILYALFSPLYPLIMLAIWINSPGPIFYGAVRQGRGGRNFKCWKFRTMVVNADEIKRKLMIQNEVDGPQFKMKNDPRIFLVGKWLRRLNIDEWPQFWNVLVGQLSVVGPRPSPE